MMFDHQASYLAERPLDRDDLLDDTLAVSAMFNHRRNAVQVAFDAV